MIAKALQVAQEMRELVPRITRREPAKVIAFQLGNIPQRTVENWQRGQSLPNAPHWVALCELFPELRAKDLEWHATALGVDPADQTRLLAEIQRLVLGARLREAR